MDTHVGNLLIDDALPEDLRKPEYTLDKKGVHALMQSVAEKHPDDYKAVLQKLNNIGRDAVYNSGQSVSLSALKKSPAKERVLGAAKAKVQQIVNDDKIPDEQKDQAIIDTLMPLGHELTEQLFQEAKAEGNPFYDQILSGSRGKKSDFNSLRGAELLTSDHNGKIIPVPMLNSYADGLDPVEYFAGMYGQRRGAVGVKFATGDAGYLNKQLVNATHRLVVNKETPEATRLPVGLPVPTDDKDNVGAVLAKDTGGIAAGTTLTKPMLDQLKEAGEDEVVIHSPMTEQSADGGISRFAAGNRDRFGLSQIGDNVGIPAAQSIGEKLSQGMLSCLVEGTLVRMADFTVRPIEQLVPGDWVLGADKLGRTFPVKVNHFFDNGEQPCVETVFRVGQRRTRVLRSTTSHKVLAATYFTNHSEESMNGVPRVVPVGKKNRDFRCLAPTGFDTAFPMKSEPVAYMIGMLLGDRYQMGHKYAHEKTLPACVHSWDNDSVANLIAGLIDTDGTVFQRKVGKHQTATVGYCSTSRAMLEGVRDLLEWRFGIYGTATHMLRPDAHASRNAKHPLYSFSISDHDSLTRFTAAIPLKGVKASRLQQYMSPFPPKKRTHGGSCRRSSQLPIGVQHVFDIEVDHPDHLFVLANGLVVSNSKHSAGMAKVKGGREGFEYLNRLIQAPETFPESGPLAEKTGYVKSVKKAPQGGHYITVDDHEHYAPASVTPTVAEGQGVEAGDSLTDGIPHPADLIRHHGIGEGRRVYMNLLKEALDNSGIQAHRRNLEPVVAGLMNWAKVTSPEGFGEHLPDDIAGYNSLVHGYQPRPDATLTAPKQAVGRYLDEPALHYGIGTQVTKKVAAHLHKHGIKDVHTHHEAPGIEPYFQRGMLGVHADPDFSTQLGGFYTSSAFQKSVEQGAESDPNSTSFVGALAKGTDFGKNLGTTGKYGA